MKHYHSQGLSWLAFDHLSLEKNMVHGTFLRHGGVSKGSFGSLNLGFSAGDNPEYVKENIHRACAVLEIKNIIAPFQEHGDTVLEVNSSTLGQKLVCDGVITQTSHLGLMIRHADCQAAIFYDPIQKAIGCVHSGWRGTVKNIYKRCIEKMYHSFGSEPSHILVGISPSLGPTAAEFKYYKNELPSLFWPFQVKDNYFDFWAISKMQLLECGILKQKIEIAKICTYENHKDFFSYRREKISGRHATLVALRE